MNARALLGRLSIVVVLGTGCTSSKGAAPAPDSRGTVTGRLPDAASVPVAAATITVMDDAASVTSDADGDGLTDYAELRAYKSNPSMTDSDGDSRAPSGTAEPDPNLWDGAEVLVSGTSPTLADTDGDGRTDWEEIHAGGTSPLVADLPALAPELYGDPMIVPPTQVKTICTTGDVQLSRQETEQADTDSTSTKMSIENTVKLHTEAEAGTGQ